MSAIFNELRLIEAKRASGAITAKEFARQKSALLDEVPDAFETSPSEPRVVADTGPTIWDILLPWLLAALLCGVITWAVTGSVGMASTFGITVLAAFTIKLFTALD